MTIVPGYGNRNARILFLGEAPASEEVKLGRPFVGRAGKQFDSLLADAGIKRDDCYVTNSILRPVEGDKDKFFFARKAGKRHAATPSDYLIEGMQALQKDLEEIKPCVVVPLGNYALWTMMLHQSIMNWRGSVLWSDLWQVKVLPTIHPAALLYMKSNEPGATSGGGGMWKMRPVIVWDLEKANHEANFSELRRKDRTLLVNPTGTEHDEAVSRLLRSQRLIIDIESFGGTNLACVGFSDGDPSWAVTWSYDGIPDRLSLFRDLVSRDVPVVGQNIMYDATMLDQLGVHIKNIEFDTMIASHTIYPDLPKGLDFLESVYTDIPYYKEEGKSWLYKPVGEGLQQFYTYNAKDVCGTAEVSIAQRQEMDERKLWPYFRAKMDAFQPCREATGMGMKCNVPLLREFITENNLKIVKTTDELNASAGRNVNVKSPKQMQALVYDQWKLPVKTKKGSRTTEEKALKDLMAKTDDKRLGLIVLLRKYEKLKSNYYKESIIGSDGRIHYNFNLVGTRFGRLSSDKPLWGPGLNIQNIPARAKNPGHKARRIFIADDGCEFAEFDQSQAEALIVAYLADDPVHIACFRNGWDVHRATACLLIGKDMSEWASIDKDDPIRELTKKCNHALNYMMGWALYMAVVNQDYDPEEPDSLRIDAATAKATVAQYMTIRPALNNYWDGIKYELNNNNRTLINLLGWPYQFLDTWSDSLVRDAVSFKPQSTVGMQTVLAMGKVHKDPTMRELGVRFMSQTHDSILFQWPKENRKEIVPRIWPLLETELYVNGYRIVVPWEGKVGQTWYKKDMEDLGMSRKTPEVGYAD
jgi:uracil-DNA glycosylase family 4